MNVIELTLERVEVCTKLYMDVFSKSPWNELWNYQAANDRLLSLFHHPSAYCIGVYNSEQVLIGFLIGHTENWLGVTHFLIKEMCVSAPMQGQGVGSIMLSSLERYCKEKNIDRIELITAHGGLAEQFYKKNGFYTSNKMILMAKRLPK
ncbi:GNAT family N-acetyltransferase [Aquibacillus koreensis]|uniref:GNAT family N-acetyltransferase n=1 Tax=Aquibacillus koreensis TaxID=279446 RepID=A0A9X4AJS0_9BACI|nr:GNAT family N-acetyltransferase [Aquibacillus koreensis]MCT2534240.1 GNAT family N-acetyltransferase [Aquibacillus koreensis]MDC3420715.1 GNAT family N-acetyltransferase [Aquibacillus koreensis]